MGAKFGTLTIGVEMMGEGEMMEVLESDWTQVVCGMGRGGKKKWAVERI